MGTILDLDPHELEIWILFANLNQLCKPNLLKGQEVHFRRTNNPLLGTI